MGAEREPIAITGIGCRFPGGVRGPRALWEALTGRLDAIGPVPADRFDVGAYFDPRPGVPGRMSTRWGGFLEDIDRFDPFFFGISPREAERLDPQQRLLLEVAWDAIEDAGHSPASLAPHRVGVFVGMWLQDFETRLFRDPEAVDLYATTGTGRYAASGRLSHTFRFRGPAITLDTACSSSLVAVHRACMSLWSGECGAALAGGANVILQPHITLAYSRSGMMAPDGRCKFGDARANGYVRSEGAGMVLLKPLRVAQAAGDPIYAVILGGAVNNDGHSGEHFVTPAQDGQEEMLRLAWQDAGVPLERAVYVEAHGTGTAAGDPVEVGALGAVLGRNRERARPCLIGSIKTNFGHTEGAAGVAGLIKAALILRHGAIPASLHLEQPNPAIPWAELGVRVADREVVLAPGSDPVVGVSSFGIAGTNAHVVLAPAPGLAPTAGSGEPGERTAALPFLLSAHTPAALRELAAQTAEWTATERVSAGALAHALASRRARHPHRLGVIASSREELDAALRAFAREGNAAEGAESGEAPAGEPYLVFVFPGQGSQWVGMGRRLLASEPVFRETIDACDRAARPFIDWSIREQLEVDAGHPALRLDRIDVIQPVLVAVDLALAALWRSWGLEPAAVIGHSMGEVAAAHAAGALTLEDAMRVICTRSRLMLRIAGRGAMALVELPADELQAALESRRERVSMAAANGPRSSIVSGDPAAVDELIAELEAREVFCRRVAVDVASHSPQVDELTGDLLSLLEPVRPLPASIPFQSTVQGQRLDGPELDARYWAANLRSPVLFAGAVAAQAELARAAGRTPVFVEVSPHAVLVPSVQQTLRAGGGAGVAVGTLRRDEDERTSLLRTLRDLWLAGVEPSWPRVLGAPPAAEIRFPPYPWQKERYWLEVEERGGSVGGGHPVLGRPLRTPTGVCVWEGAIDLEKTAFLRDHRVRGRVVLPAAASLELALNAALELGAGAVLENVEFDEMVELEGGAQKPTRVLLSLEPRAAGASAITLHARGVDAGEHGAWRAFARARVLAGATPLPRAGVPSRAPAADAGAGPEPDAGDAAHYGSARLRGLEYGAAFRGVQTLERTADGARGDVRLTATETGIGFRVHPALLDAVFQVALAAVSADANPAAALLPVSARRVHWHHAGEPVAAGRARAQRTGELEADVVFEDAAGQPVIEVQGLRFVALPHPAADEHLLHSVEWVASELPAQPASAAPGRWLLVGAGAVADAVAASLRAAGAQVRSVSTAASADQVRAWIGEGRSDELAGVVHLGALDEPAAAPAGAQELLAAQAAGVESLLAVVRGALSSAGEWRLWIITREAQGVQAGDAVRGVVHSPLWGMGAVIEQELPSVRAQRIDVEALSAEVVAGQIAAELARADGERRVAYRGGRRLAARLAHSPARPVARDAAAVRAYRLVPERPGMLDSLALHASPRRRPRAGEVEIEVAAVGLNFLNVLSALGTCPGFPNGVGPLGIEAAGTIVRVGEDVRDFAPGDRVAAFAQDAAASHTVVPAELVVKLPADTTFEEGASWPIAFLTAYYGLEYLARLTAGERVLIHSATGGVGMAALQLARSLGAEVYATAGSEEKRQWLREAGVAHVFDSRSLDFAEGVLAATGGEGVDVVLNSLAGPALVRSVELLRPYGRFVELGKRDIYDGSRLDLSPFRRNLSYFAVDLQRAWSERPVLLGRMLRELGERLARGEIRSIPHTSVALEDAGEAFRTMAAAKHLGKLVLRAPAVADARGVRAADPLFREDGTYLVTGGLGGIGFAVAEWLAQRGAGALVLVGRSEPSTAALARVQALRATGVDVELASADVADDAAMRGIVARIAAGPKPLRGVLHAAGLLADATLGALELERFRRPLVPKLAGAWTLHRLTEGVELDCFVLFSSVAGVLGTPGQANYAAGNAFLDALADHRRARGLPATSVAWGPWSGLGLAAASEDRGARLAAQGLGSIDPAEGLELLGRALASGEARAIAMRFDAPAWAASNPASNADPFLAGLRTAVVAGTAGAAEREGLRGRMRAAATSAESAQLLHEQLRRHIAAVLRIPEERISGTAAFKTLGMDSLMTLELRNRIEAELGFQVPATAIWNYSTLDRLGTYLFERCDVGTAGLRAETAAVAPDAPAPVAAATKPWAAVDLEDLSVDELSSLLDEELKATDDLLQES